MVMCVPTYQSTPGPTTSSDIILDVSTVPPLQPKVSHVVTLATPLEPLPPAVSLLQPSVNTTKSTSDSTDKPAPTCDLCHTTLKSKGALVKDRVLNLDH